VAGGNAERLLGIKPLRKVASTRKPSSPRKRGPGKRRR
jgi:hypothetical protein